MLLLKKERHRKILELIENNTVSTQGQILEHLQKEGFDVTQATVSRDIGQLGLVKVRNEDGKLKYSVSYKAENNKAEPTLRKSVINIDSAGNIAVIKCRSGMASAVCAEIDSMRYPSIVGTLAGDDTIFILFKTCAQAEKFKNNYNREE